MLHAAFLLRRGTALARGGSRGCLRALGSPLPPPGGQEDLRSQAATPFAAAPMARRPLSFMAGKSALAPCMLGGARGMSAAAIGEDDQMALLTHMCTGLRQVLASAPLPIQPKALLPQVQLVSGALPKGLEDVDPAFTTIYLAMAFEYEMGFAAQAGSQEALQGLLGLAIECAEAGILQHYDPLWLMDGVEGLDSAYLKPPEPRDAGDVTPWHLFGNPSLGASAGHLAGQLRQFGFAAVDGFLGPVMSEAVARDMAAFAGAEGARFRSGELDETGRSDVRFRGDRICWLGGGELERPLVGGMAQFLVREKKPGNISPRKMKDPRRGDRICWLGEGELERPLVGGMAQLLRTRFLERLSEALPDVRFIHPRLHMAKAMLAVYPPGSVGFVAHTDKSGDSDLRKLTAVYYLNDGWEEGHGGELVVHPGEEGREVVVPPVRDRLVLLWSDSTTHEVRPTTEGAAERLAVSFWYLEEPR